MRAKEIELEDALVESAWSEFERGEDWGYLRKDLTSEDRTPEQWAGRAMRWARAWLRADLARGLRGIPADASEAVAWKPVLGLLDALGDGAAFRELEEAAYSIPAAKRESSTGRMFASDEKIAEQMLEYVSMLWEPWRRERQPQRKLLAIAQKKMLEADEKRQAPSQGGRGL